MRRFLLSATLVATGLALSSCSDNTSSRNNQVQAPQRPKNLILECAMTSTKTMNGEALEPKIAKLWVDSFRGFILRADGYGEGGVVRNGYSTETLEVTEDLKKHLAENKIATDWAKAYRYSHYEIPKLVLMSLDERSGLVVTLNRDEIADQGGELAQLACAPVDRASAPANTILIAAAEPPKPLTNGCADSTVEQDFTADMVGCSGAVRYAQRAGLCGAGWTPCTAVQWVARHGGKAPTFHYWTEDNLRYTGTSTGRCSVSTTMGSFCSPNPMRVCNSMLDSLGNRCSWMNCGLGSYTNQFFGGCGYPTAGTLCCQ